MEPSNTKLQEDEALPISADAVPRPSTWGEHIAYWISHLGSPPAMAIYAVICVAVSTPAAPWAWIGLFFFLSLIAPMLFLVWQLRRGDVTDIDIHFPQQRKRALLVTIAGFAVTWVVMTLGDAPPILRLLVGTGLVDWSIIFFVTLRWKISIHAAAISSTVTYLVWGFGINALPALLAIPVIGWSRVKLRRHTPAQVIAGIGLGSLSFGTALACSRYLIRTGMLVP